LHLNYRIQNTQHHQKTTHIFVRQGFHNSTNSILNGYFINSLLFITKQEIRKLREYARNTLQKDKRINIRMSSKDLDQVQVIAAQEGIPYQTLISSIIHKYVSGYLLEKKRA